MLFTIDKNKSLALLQAVMAFFPVLAPSVLELFPVHSGVYALFIVFTLIFTVRIKKTQRVYFSPVHLVLLPFLGYVIISSLWAKNNEGHLLYTFIIMTVIVFLSTAIDYFKESSSDNINRRMMYLLLSSGTLCAVINIAYWFLYILPVGGKNTFSFGMGTNDFLAVFMLFCMMCALALIKSNSQKRRRFIILGFIIMLFVFVMSKSLIGFIAAILICVITISSKQSEKMFLPVSLISVAVLAGISIAVSTVMPWGEFTGDLFDLFLSRPMGSGGGVVGAQTLYASKAYGKDISAPISALIIAQSGILGAVCTVAIYLRTLIHFLKLRNESSLISLLVLTLMMILPFGNSYAVLFLWLGLFACNEQSLSMCMVRNFKSSSLEKTVYTLAVVTTVCALLFMQCFMRVCADKKFNNEDYMSAYSIYRAAAAINISDSESCRMAAKSLRKGAEIKAMRDEAVALIDKAIKRDETNLENIVEKARIYSACEEYDLCAQQYRIASRSAKVNEKYNLALSKTLYKIVQKNPKGSSETKRAYEEILTIAQETQNLDYRKEINDIADKALVFTKGELTDEENN